MSSKKNVADSPNGSNIPKKRVRTNFLESGNSEIQKDGKDLTAISFFQSHQDDHLKRYIVIQEISNFYSHMIKEEHSSLASILGKLMDDVGKDVRDRLILFTK